MEFVFLLVGIAILIAALSYFAFSKRNKQRPAAQSQKPALVNCPMCGSGLQKGQNIYSKVFRPMNVPDQRCVITGCPHCYPVCEIGVKRVCPVCGKYTFIEDDNFEICPVCGWEDDGIQRDDPDYAGGANHLSLNQYKSLERVALQAERLGMEQYGVFCHECLASDFRLWQLHRHPAQRPALLLPRQDWP